MSKFYQYINEQRSKSIDLDKAIDLIKKNCRDILKNYKNSSIRIYRGSPFSGYAGLVNPQKYTRYSANTRNYYTLLFDYILPSGKKYPNRSKSIVCTSVYRVAADYGNPYVVFPFDGAKIGICPEDDIGDSFEEIGLEDFNNYISTLLTKGGFSVDEAQFDPDYLKNSLLSMKESYNTDVSFKKVIDGYFAPDIIKKIFKSDEDIIETLDKLLSPNNNKFKLIKTSDGITKYLRGEHEVGTDAKSVMINARKMDVEKMIREM